MFTPRGIAVASILVCASLALAGLAGAELRKGPDSQGPTAEPPAGAAASQVDVLIRQLGHRRTSVRREALVRLAELGPAAGPAIPRLMECLKDSDLLVRAHAARAACRIGLAPEPVVPVLAALLEPQKPQACCLAALILGDLGPTAREAVPALRGCLAAPAAVVRLHAAEAVLKIAAGDEQALSALLAALNDEQDDVRYFAVNALGSSGVENFQARCAVARALTDSDTNVAAAAGLNLSKMDDCRRPGEAPPIDANGVAVLSPELAHLTAELVHSSVTARQAAAIRIAQAGPSARPSADALRARLADRDLIVRVHAARALCAIGGHDAVILPVLVDLLAVDTPNVAVAAAFVLGRMGPQAAAALPSLHERLAASDLLDRLVLADAIAGIDPRDRDALNVLTGGLHDPEGDVRYLSAIALGDAPLAHQRLAEKALSSALNDRNLRVQSAAADALEQLQTRCAEARKIEAEQRRRLPPAAVASTGAKAAPPAAPAVAPPAARPAERVPVDVFEPMLMARQAANEARAAAQVATQAAAAARAAAQERAAAQPAAEESEEELAQADEEEPLPDTVPSIGDDEVEPAGAQAENADPAEMIEAPSAVEEYDEGLKPIGSLGASIKMQGPEPPNLAALRFASVPTEYHGIGTKRGWRPTAYGWDPPAVFFKPLYFEDINLERYGIHFGWAQGPVSWYCFFNTCLFLPYKLAVQPPCECIYTMGYERPNNCIPLHCYWSCCSECKRWCKTGPCPVKPPCPWDYSEHALCPDECEK